MAQASGDEAVSNVAEGVGRIDLRNGLAPDKEAFNRDEFNLKKIELIRTVGTGSFGRVMAVREKESGIFYALKILVIEDVIRLKQVEHVKSEKAILEQVNHPFIVNLYWTNHDIKFLYMLFEYVCGGELFSYLRNSGKFTNGAANFYAAEIVAAVSYLHGLQIVYRDLKPENLLLDIEGHVKITDFGFAKVLTDRTYTMCGTPEYLAPEIIQGKGYSRAVDWWALGILIFEMLIGYPPFYDDNPMQIYQKILQSKYDFPRDPIDANAKDLIKRLLVSDRTKRLGNMKGGVGDIQKHRWFKHLNWDDVHKRKVKPPIVPKVNHAGDTRNYDAYEEQDWKKVPVAHPKSQELFRDF